MSDEKLEISLFESYEGILARLEISTHGMESLCERKALIVRCDKILIMEDGSINRYCSFHETSLEMRFSPFNEVTWQSVDCHTPKKGWSK